MPRHVGIAQPAGQNERPLQLGKAEVTLHISDAVDALADNRGELLFELRGDTTRQFALYRVLRGRADKLFTTFGGNLGQTASE